MSHGSILFTNLYLAGRTGSELHINTLAKRFKQDGWDVTCYTLVAAEPLLSDFRAAGITVVEFGQEYLLGHHYDVLYAQHHVVCDYLCSAQDISFGDIVISVLGAANEYELLPSIAKYASAVTFISQEAKDNFADDLRRLDIESYVFPNYATKEYFNSFDASVAHSRLNKVAVISNHPPQEVLDLPDRLPSSSIDFYGYPTNSVEITPELLSKYDLVITIGRTVQFCFAAGIPVYIYDHFAGPGYLFDEVFDHERYCNFSGRSSQLRKTSKELADDILDGYGHIKALTLKLRSDAMRLFNFEHIYSELCQLIESSSHHNVSFATAESTRCEKFKRRNLAELFLDDYLNKDIGTAQLYYWCDDQHEHIEENLSVKFKYHYGSEIEVDVKELAPSKDHTCLARFDPDTKPCIMNIDIPGIVNPSAPYCYCPVDDMPLSMYSRDPTYWPICPEVQTFTFKVDAIDLIGVLSSEHDKRLTAIKEKEDALIEKEDALIDLAKAHDRENSIVWTFKHFLLLMSGRRWR